MIRFGWFWILVIGFAPEMNDLMWFTLIYLNLIAVGVVNMINYEMCGYAIFRRNHFWSISPNPRTHLRTPTSFLKISQCGDKAHIPTVPTPQSRCWKMVPILLHRSDYPFNHLSLALWDFISDESCCYSWLCLRWWFSTKNPGKSTGNQALLRKSSCLEPPPQELPTGLLVIYVATYISSTSTLFCF